MCDFRNTSPAVIKSEPEEDNGFYPSPQNNKSFKREYDDDEEWVSFKFILNPCAYVQD